MDRAQPTSCMGGYGCHLREECARHLAEDRSNPSERMCLQGTSDAWMPIEAEGMTMTRMLKGQGRAALAELAGRPGGVSAKEFAAHTGQAIFASQQMLRRYARDGLVIERKGTEGGAQLCRYWTSAEAAEAFQFDMGYQARLAERIVETLKQQHKTVRELCEATGANIRTVHTEAKTLVLLGRIVRADDLCHRGQVVHRFFADEASMRAWLAIPGNDVAAVKAARQGDPRELAAAAERARYQRKKAEKQGGAIAERSASAPAVRKRAKTDIETVRANEVAAAIQEKQGARKPSKTPPALQPGEPVITAATKITRVPAPPGRYETRDRVVGGFATKRIGEYDRPASAWAEASCA